MDNHAGLQCTHGAQWQSLEVEDPVTTGAAGGNVEVGLLGLQTL